MKSRDIVHSMSRDFLCVRLVVCRVIVPLFCVWVFLFGLVVFAGVDGVLGDDFAGCFVYCDGVGSVDEQDDSLAVVGMAYAEESESAGVAEGDFSVAVDAVVSDSPVGVAQLNHPGFRS
ncbi:hypothetical protein HMPREF2757_02525 [Brevibacterium sp. HMSC063G07]|nr:hypothetical protein HMPREF2757_02525 [Brevibacterium sp. HMSC063G07]